MAKISLEDFLSGKPLRYKGWNRRTHHATFEKGVGIRILREKKPRVEDLAAVTTVAGAKAFYYNATRRNPGGDEEDGDDD